MANIFKSNVPLKLLVKKINHQKLHIKNRKYSSKLQRCFKIRRHTPKMYYESIFKRLRNLAINEGSFVA
jgi:hypothetical protein